MEPDVIRIYSSSPPPMEDATEDEDDFGGFSGVPNSISFTEFDTPTTFNQTQALSATSPPELLGGGGGGGGGGRAVTGFSHSSSNGDLSKANGVAPPERTEVKKTLSGSLELSASDCNGGGAEVLTNGFATFDLQGSPSSQNSVHSHVKGSSTEDSGSGAAGSPDHHHHDFADFAAFSSADGRRDLDSAEPSGAEGGVRDTTRTGPRGAGSDSSPGPAEAPGGSCNTDRGPEADPDSQRDAEPSASDAVCTNAAAAAATAAAALNGDESKDAAAADSDLSPGDGAAGRSDGKSSGNDTETETETETETSLGRPLSTDALEEFGDVSTTGSAPSPPPQGDTATPGELSQLAEDDEDFGDFGDAGSFAAQGFADFEQLDVPPERSAPPQETPPAKDDDDFGDFNSPEFQSGGADGSDGGGFADFPVSDSFGNFSSAAAAGGGGGADAGWSAFGEPEQQEEDESWAAFSTEQSAAPPAGRREEQEEQEQQQEEEEEEQWHESEPVSDEGSRTDRQTASLCSRLEKLFQSSFPQAAAPPVQDQVTSLKVLLGPSKPGPGSEEEERPPCHRSLRGGVWTQLQDIHEALGLRYQWGGSHCNKALLCCLGIDTRNILFTGQKKQPVIVPMYAASLGMLEPTKEPVKPVSAAEMIASIAQTPPVAPETSPCPPDSVQEALPPVQFDWSSSGLTNPLDASGGSSLLNLDFFGPVEDSGSSSSPSIPGVDPELFELTTAKMDAGGSSSRVADAFARLMSTMEKTSTSTRKPTKKEENLSEEASTVIAALPDLSFMQAKVLMFPATLTPLGCQATPD